MTNNGMMNKVLLVYEDYSELMAIESLLKRVGFDVIGVTSEYSMTEQVLAFNPDLVVGAGRGGKVSAIGVGKRLKEMTRWHGKSVLIFQPNFKPAPHELMRIRVDMVLEAPVLNSRLVQVVGRLLGHDDSVLQERLSRSSEALGKDGNSSGMSVATGRYESSDQPIYVRGAIKPGPSAPSASENTHSTDISDSFSDSAFAEEDLSVLEKDLLGTGVPKVERIDEAYETDKTKDNFKSDVAFESKPENSTDWKEIEKSLSSKPVNPGEPESSSFGKALAADGSDLRDLEASLQRALEQEDALRSQKSGTQSDKNTFFSEHPSDEDMAEIQKRAVEELAQATESLRKKKAKYQTAVAEVKLSPKSELTRVEARRRQKQLIEEWDQEKNNDNDELRRRFTVALFKK
jgi:hypothetical protein